MKTISVEVARIPPEIALSADAFRGKSSKGGPKDVPCCKKSFLGSRHAGLRSDKKHHRSGCRYGHCPHQLSVWRAGDCAVLIFHVRVLGAGEGASTELMPPFSCAGTRTEVSLLFGPNTDLRRAIAASHSLAEVPQ